MDRYTEVTNILGMENYTTLIDQVQHGLITQQTLKDMSMRMDPKVHGVFVEQLYKPEIKLKDILRQVLDSWWDVTLYQMESTDAISLLKEILMDENVGQKALAHKIRPVHDMLTSGLPTTSPDNTLMKPEAK